MEKETLGSLTLPCLALPPPRWLSCEGNKNHKIPHLPLPPLTSPKEKWGAKDGKPYMKLMNQIAHQLHMLGRIGNGDLRKLPLFIRFQIGNGATDDPPGQWISIFVE